MTNDTYNNHLAEFIRKSDGRFPKIEQLPCLKDDESSHDYCPVYLHFNAWASRVLLQSRPAKHVDFGGLTYFVGIMSALIPMEYYDIRPLNTAIPNLKTGVADLTRLPFPDEHFESVSCLHTAEHVGMGRYGDELDVNGDLKAAKELCRVVKKGGQLIIVLPVGNPRVCFNAHRIYSYQQVIDMFPGFELKEFTLFDPPQYIVNANPERVKGITEGAGCFWFTK